MDNPKRKPTTPAKVLLKKRPRKVDPDCLLIHEDLARKYVENAKQRTERDPWESFLYGLVLTGSPAAEYHEEALKGLKEIAPGPEPIHKTCYQSGQWLTTLEDVPAANRYYKAEQIKTAMCEASRPKTEFSEVDDGSGKLTKVPTHRDWNHFKDAMQDCKRKAVQDHYYFQSEKGADMLLLESGCETPVMDIHMLRHVFEDILPKSWSDAEVTRQLKTMQGRPIDYDLAKQEVQKEAKMCGLIQSGGNDAKRLTK